MDHQTALLIAWSMGTAAASYGLLAAYLISLGQTWHSSKRARAMLAAIVLAALWAIAGTLFALSGKLVFLFSSSLLDILRYGAWYVFLILLLSPANAGQRSERVFPSWLIPLCWAIVLGGLALHLALALQVLPAAQLARAQLLQALGMIVLALILLEQLFRNVTDDARWNVKPLCLALFGQFGFDLYLYSDALLFNQIDADAYAIRGFVHALVIPLLLVATVRSRDWTAKIRLSQKAAFHTATLLIAAIYLLFMAAVGYYVRFFGGDWGRALQLSLLFASLLFLGILGFSGAMRAKLRVLVGKHFFSYRYDYREEWLRFTQTLSAQDSPQAMGEQVIRGLANMVESPAGGLWLKEPGQSGFRMGGRWNIPASDEIEDGNSSLCRFLVDSGWVINLEEYRASPGRYVDLIMPEWVYRIPNVWLIVPLMVSHEMTGFVILTSARTQIEVNWEVNDLLRTAGCQAAGFLARMQAAEALLEAQKFDAFNRMSAFVVHDLKNIVTQLSLMLRNAERHSSNPEFQQDMLMTVEHSVERMRQLMMQLREGATPPGTACGVLLPDVIERIGRSKMEQGRHVELKITERLATRGHEERLERVIGHLVQNALDATPEHGRVWVSLGKRGDRAVVEVGDTGQGMSQEFIRERLFKPFQSTKQAGMGIGAYESAQYIRELGGELQVESQENMGTRVTMVLPLFEAGSRSDLHETEPA
jgi:putative PEP-CTERM system histidine kinase